MNPTSAQWTELEIQAAIPVLQKIAHCFKTVRPENRPLPHQVYEFWAATSKLIAIEIGVFKGDMVYLIQRPDAHEDPHEPWPAKLHLPGVTLVPYETSTHAIERLKLELGGVTLADSTMVGLCDYHPLPRAPVTTLLYLVELVETMAEPINAQGAFYPIHQVSTNDTLIPFHRDLLLPMILAERHRSK